MKLCTRCDKVKPVESFYPDKNKKDGRKYACIPCHNAYNNKLRNANPEPHRIANLAYSRTEQGRYNQRARQLKTKFWPDLTPDQAAAEYDKLLTAQSHCCGLCGKHKSNFKMNLAVDHCHETGVVRGLLCNKCNRFEVGRHTLKTAEQLVAYLRKTANLHHNEGDNSESA